MQNYTPAEITADRQKKQLTIVWDDGHTSVLPLARLRNACPCAACRGGHENMSPEPDADDFTLPLVDTRATMLRTVQLVGNYALTIEWEDGHHFGIYTWAYLRALEHQGDNDR